MLEIMQEYNIYNLYNISNMLYQKKNYIKHMMYKSTIYL